MTPTGPDEVLRQQDRELDRQHLIGTGRRHHPNLGARPRRDTQRNHSPVIRYENVIPFQALRPSAQARVLAAPPGLGVSCAQQRGGRRLPVGVRSGWLPGPGSRLSASGERSQQTRRGNTQCVGRVVDVRADATRTAAQSLVVQPEVTKAARSRRASQSLIERMRGLRTLETSPQSLSGAAKVLRSGRRGYHRSLCAGWCPPRGLR